MKKNITINLNGSLFNIDEDAYEMLDHYTESIRRYFSKQEGSEEVANDIEARIVELFEEMSDNGKRPIDKELTESVIRRIGELKDIIPDNSESPKEETEKEAKPKEKRLYRDSTNSILTGMLAGLAKYFGGTAKAWRILFLCIVMLPILSYLVLPIYALPLMGFSLPLSFILVFLYVVAAIISPKAETPEDMLQMKGMRVTPQNIAEEVSRQQKKSAKSGIWNVIKSVIVSGIGIWAIILLVITIGLFVGSIVNGDMTVMDFLIGDTGFTSYPMKQSMIKDGYIFASTSKMLILFFISAICGLFSLAYCCIHSLVKTMGKAKPMGFVQKIVWIGVILLSGIVAFSTAKNVAKMAVFVGRANETAENAFRVHMGNYSYRRQDLNYYNIFNWKVTNAVNTKRNEWTAVGQYYTGNPKARYFNAHSENNDLIFQAETNVMVEPGRYTLSGICRASEKAEGAYIWVAVTVNGEEICERKLLEIMGEGSKGNRLYGEGEYALPSDHEKIYCKTKNVNNSEGYGWAYYTIEGIEVPEGARVLYGISTDPNFTHKPSKVEWVSACDFELKKEKV